MIYDSNKYLERQLRKVIPPMTRFGSSRYINNDVKYDSIFKVFNDLNLNKKRIDITDNRLLFTARIPNDLDKLSDNNIAVEIDSEGKIIIRHDMYSMDPTIFIIFDAGRYSATVYIKYMSYDDNTELDGFYSINYSVKNNVLEEDISYFDRDVVNEITTYDIDYFDKNYILDQGYSEDYHVKRINLEIPKELINGGIDNLINRVLLNLSDGRIDDFCKKIKSEINSSLEKSVNLTLRRNM